jgi:hypothetical protein
MRSYADESQFMTGRRGLDRNRNTVIGKMDFKLQYFEEVFTSQHWMMRIYRCVRLCVVWRAEGRAGVLSLQH